MSNNLKSDFFDFFSVNVTTKKKCFEKRVNVCKWLKNLYRYYSAGFNDHFKPIKNFLALKTAEIQAFENLKRFFLDFEHFEHFEWPC